MATHATNLIKLGNELRQSRDAAGMTQGRAAAALGWSQSKIAKIEAAQRKVKLDDLEKLIHLYRVSDATAEQMRMLLATLPSQGPTAGAAPSDAYRLFLQHESAASEVLALYTERIPKLFQSEQYMFSQYTHAGLESDLGEAVRSRHERVALLASPLAPHYRVIFGASSFRRMPGGINRECVVDQADHMLRLSEKYNTFTFQILPEQAPLLTMPSDLTVLRFGDPTKKDMVYVEISTSESRLYQDKTLVATQTRDWEMAHKAALDVDASKDFLSALIAEAYTW